MARLLATAAIAAVVVVVARILASRRTRGPTTVAPASGTVPTTLDREDFAHPERDWLVAVFTSATCRSCQGTLDEARPLESPEIAVQEIEVVRDHELHERYRIDAVPTLVISDRSGRVRASFLGPLSNTDLPDALAELASSRPAPPENTGPS